ncbi:MAG: protoporphyrinogen oxidase [Armatimonadota bacterium]
MSAHVLVVGGGITGLAAAHALVTDPRATSLGVRCTLVERERRLGGKLLTERIDGCLVEAGPDAFLAAKPAAADLCRALGLGDRLIGTRPGRAVFVAYGGRLHPLPEGLALGVPGRLLPMMRTELLSAREKLRLAYDLVLPRAVAQDDVTVGAFIRRRLGHAAVDRLAGPILAGIYAGDADALSVRATFPQLLDWEASHRSLILGALARPAAQATPGVNRDGAVSVFLSVQGGMGELVDALEAFLTEAPEASLVTGQAIARLTRWFERDKTTYVADLGGGRVIAADAVILASPAYVTADLLASCAPAAASTLRMIPYASTAAVTLAFRRDEVQHPLDGHGFVVARGEPLQITACTWMSSKWPDRAPADLALLRCYLGAAGRDAIIDESDAHIIDVVRRDLRTTMSIEAAPVFTRLTRWRRAMPQYVSGHLHRLGAIGDGLRDLPGVALAGAGYRGVGIPDCIRQGTEAAGRVLDTLAATHSPA